MYEELRRNVQMNKYAIQQVREVTTEFMKQKAMQQT